MRRSLNNNPTYSHLTGADSSKVNQSQCASKTGRSAYVFRSYMSNSRAIWNRGPFSYASSEGYDATSCSFTAGKLI